MSRKLLDEQRAGDPVPTGTGGVSAKVYLPLIAQRFA